MLSISLIISTYNWPAALRLCMLSIQHQTLLPKEVIIADDGSGEQVRLLIEQFQQHFPVPVIHCWHEDNGFRKTIILNRAVKKATGTYIIQIDGDVILEKHFIADHVSVAESNVFVRGTRSHISKKLLPAVYQAARIKFSFYTPGIINRFNALRIPALAFLFEKKVLNSSRVRGSNLAYWKADFMKINGYNNDLKGWGHEDEELAVRFVNNGIFKKAIKFKLVQFHLSHDESSRLNEPEHAKVVHEAMLYHIKTCKNGAAES